MRKKRILFAVVGVAMIVYVVVSAAAVTVEPPAQERSLSSAEDAAGYVVREENNRVVVYRDGALWMKTETPVSELPKRDRVKLRRGITVYSDAELKQLIEDYCS